ncbi:Uncharacterised protein [BD1-7 clade bacterium]|nr:Uncharacterised protein [BD1-7 clade bacterium]
MNARSGLSLLLATVTLLIAGCDSDNKRKPAPTPDNLVDLCKPYCLQQSAGLEFTDSNDIEKQIDEALESSEQKDEINEKIMDDTGFSGEFSFALGGADQEAYVDKVVNRIFHVNTTIKDPAASNTTETKAVFLVLGFTTGDLEIIRLNLDDGAYKYLPLLNDTSTSKANYKACYDDREADHCQLAYRMQISYKNIVGDESTILPITALNGYIDLATGGKLQLIVGYGNETLDQSSSFSFNIFKSDIGFTVGGKTAVGGGIFNVTIDLDDPTSLPLVSVIDPNSSSNNETKAVTNIYIFTNVFKARDTNDLVLDAGILFTREDSSLPSPVVLSDIGLGGYNTRNHLIYKVLNAFPGVDRDTGGIAAAAMRSSQEKFELNEVLLSTLDVTRSFSCDVDSGDCPQQIIPTSSGILLASESSITGYVLEDNSGNAGFSRYDVDLANIKTVTGLTYNPISRYLLIYGKDDNNDQSIAYASYNGRNELSRSTDMTDDIKKIVDLSKNDLMEGFVLRGETYLSFADNSDPTAPLTILPTYRKFSVDSTKNGISSITIDRALTLGPLVEGTSNFIDRPVSFLVYGEKLAASRLVTRVEQVSPNYSNSFVVGNVQLCDWSRTSDDNKALKIDSCEAVPDYEFPGVPIRFYSPDKGASYRLVSGKVQNALIPINEYDPTPYETSIYGGLLSTKPAGKTLQSTNLLDPQICNYTPDISGDSDDDVARIAKAKKRFCYRSLPDNVTATDYSTYIKCKDCNPPTGVNP